jgi:membrane fusion protein, multidrug efflux system
MKRIVIVLLVLLVGGLVAFRLINNKKTIESKKTIIDTSAQQVAVNVAPVQSRVSEQNLNLVGTVIPNRQIEIKSEVQGKITSLNFELGQFISKGRVLARVDDQLRTIALSNAAQALANARQNLERYTRLYQGGAATQAQLQQYQLSYDNALNQVEQAKKELSNTTLVAPISGYITSKAVEAGAFANVGTAIATIVDVAKLKVQLSVGEKDAYALRVGDAVDITTAVYPGVSFRGEITFISPSGDAAHNYPIEVSITNQQKNPLKAGTYVNIAFNRKAQVATLQIPREALVGSVKEARVYVVDANRIARLRKVTIGADNGAFLEVINGLKEGEKVVTTGQINLTDSTRVAMIQ